MSQYVCAWRSFCRTKDYVGSLKELDNDAGDRPNDVSALQAKAKSSNKTGLQGRRAPLPNQNGTAVESTRILSDGQLYVAQKKYIPRCVNLNRH